MAFRLVLYAVYTFERVSRPSSSGESTHADVEDEPTHGDIEALAADRTSPHSAFRTTVETAEQMDLATAPTDIEHEFDAAEDSDAMSPRSPKKRTCTWDSIEEEKQDELSGDRRP